MLTTLTRVFLGLLAGVLLLGLCILATRTVRTVRLRRQAALAAGPRRALLNFVAEGGAEGADELVAIPEEAWRAAAPAAVALLGKIRGEAYDALVAVFERRGAVTVAQRDLQSPGRVRRARAAELLGNLGRTEAVPELCRLLADPHAEIRVVAVRALGRIGDPAAAGPLLRSLDRVEPTPSHLVAHALVQLGPDAGPAIIAALTSTRALARVTALEALGLLGIAGAADAVAGVLRGDPELDVRVAAAATLGKLGVRAGLAPLLAAVRATEPVPLRATAARSLGELGAAAAIETLGALLGDLRYAVAHEAAHALRRMGPAGLAELRRRAATDPAATRLARWDGAERRQSPRHAAPDGVVLRPAAPRRTAPRHADRPSTGAASHPAVNAAGQADRPSTGPASYPAVNAAGQADRPASDPAVVGKRSGGGDGHHAARAAAHAREALAVIDLGRQPVVPAAVPVAVPVAASTLVAVG